VLDVLCLGEALWDLHTPAGVPLSAAATLSLRPGGAAVNVALHLAGRRASVGLAAVVGAEALGEALVARVAAAGVDVAGVARSLPRTGLVFAEHAAAGDRFVGYRPADEPAPRLPRGWAARVLLLTGLLPAPEHALVLRRAARAARRQGALVVVDVNARPRLWRGRDPAAALAVLAEADVVKASADDLALLGPPRLRRAAVLVTTAGAGPARARGPFGEVARAAGAPLSASPLGAGDAFTAGLLLELLEAAPGGAAAGDGALWDRALRRGHALARAHLRRVGRETKK
jgi:sugar/nucleoside kinase (ribokinase family)